MEIRENQKNINIAHSSLLQNGTVDYSLRCHLKISRQSNFLNMFKLEITECSKLLRSYSKKYMQDVKSFNKISGL